MKKILVVAEFGAGGHSTIAELVFSCDKVLWLASNPYIPYRILKDGSHTNFEVIGFYSRFGRTINPLNLNEISLEISRGKREKSCIVVSCISELIMYHGITKVYHFLLNMVEGSERFIGMIIDGAQSEKDRLLVSTIFDAVFRVKRVEDKVVFIPELHMSEEYRSRGKSEVVEVSRNFI